MKRSAIVLGATWALLLPLAPAATSQTAPDPTSPAPTEASPSASGVGAPAKPVTVRVLKPASLERGAGAKVPTLQGGRLRPADGSGVLRVTVPAVRGQLRLLGRRSDGSWMVAAQTQVAQRVHAIAPDGTHAPVPGTRTGVQRQMRAGWLLSRDGTALVQTKWGAYDSKQVIRDAVTGKVLQGFWTDRSALPLDADEGRLVVRLDRGVRDIVPDVSNDRVVRNANGAVIARDLLFARVKGLRHGPTSISDPGTPDWSARFAALDVSPDGKLVLGTRLTRTFDRKPRVLELRRMSDGRLLQAFRYGGRTEPSDIHTQDEQTARFESSSRFVLEVRRQKRSILVRCTVGGSCQRASGWGPRISVPQEKYVWWHRLNS